MENNLTTFSTKMMKRMVKQTEILLKHYTDKNPKRTEECPLCEVSLKVQKSSCFYCGWEIFEGRNCSSFRDNQELFENHLFEELINTNEPIAKKWRKVRIPMLRNWIKEYKKELRRRKAPRKS